MTIEEEIIANDILRSLSQHLDSPYLKEVLADQTVKGLAKYPNTVKAEDHTEIEWIDHNVQELMDSSVYYTALIQKIEAQEPSKSNEIRLYFLREDLLTNISKMQRLEVLRKVYVEERNNEPNKVI